MNFKRIIFIIFINFFILITNPSIVSATGSWVQQTSSGERDWRSITSSADGTKLAAVDHDGYIYTSSDSGTTWIQQTNSGARDWYRIVSSSNGERLAAIMEFGNIYLSNDSGLTWNLSSGAGARNWNALTTSSSGDSIFAGVKGGYIYSTENLGVVWNLLSNSGNRYWYAITSSADGTKLAAVNYLSGYIYTSEDSGANWTEQSNSGNRYWYAITSSADGTKLAATEENGYIYTSPDSGATWIQQTNSGARDWRSITSSADGTKLAAVDHGGYIYISSDSGVNWIAQTTHGSRDWTSITSSADGTKLAATEENGYIYTLSTTINEIQSSGGSGGSDVTINASCKVSNKRVKVGDVVNFELEVEKVSNSKKDEEYNFRWTKLLKGSKEKISYKFDKPGEYKARAQINTRYKNKIINCDKVIVSAKEVNNNTKKESIIPNSINRNLFTKDLFFTINSTDVKLLQQFLNNKGYIVADWGPGSKGNETTIFGFATRAALIRFQKDNNISPALGYFGPKTRELINNF